ncbi:hypothetical protein TNIN_428991 [Trichonephila inaurata madagascariensis]|uniref:Uncharacterized protein n=1 Tax=Trichonephila inaurata madagascariensis TaxID=2747483 RepID=A0A8X7CB32_9ARAC|nr:hypothetical protein TNIN_428991 [Trichonephila inaurata madagascariensis]
MLTRIALSDFNEVALGVRVINVCGPQYKTDKLALVCPKDSKQRVAKVKTGSSDIIRPLQRLHHLELRLIELPSFNGNIVSSSISERNLGTGGRTQSHRHLSSNEDNYQKEKLKSLKTWINLYIYYTRGNKPQRLDL